MIYFDSDYLEGCIPEILSRLQECNLEQTPGYGVDDHCAHAADLIRHACANPSADVHFLVGGTQTNATVISALLRPYQGVICAPSGHIAVHETGAIEHIGHKVLCVEGDAEGKIKASAITACVSAHYADPCAEHTVQPAMVYISFPTERGAIYSLAELEEISAACHDSGVLLFIDGARLGYGLCSSGCDVTLPDIASLADVFYIGGTKQGALFGEAVVFRTPALSRDFRYSIKQNGGMLAKGRLLGIQFETLFEDLGGDCLYYRYSRHAVELALRLRDALAAAGYSFLAPSPSNQQFPILENSRIAALRAAGFSFEDWAVIDPTHTAVRFVTSWATPSSSLTSLLSAL